MRVELQERDRTMAARMRAQERIGDEMIAAEAEHLRAGAQDRICMRLDRLDDRLRPVRIEKAIAIVDHREMRERIEAERKRLQLRQLHRCGADRLRPEATARPKRDRRVVRHAADGDVDAGEVARVAPARKLSAPP